jgi:hypothetical protein
VVAQTLADVCSHKGAPPIKLQAGEKFLLPDTPLSAMHLVLEGHLTAIAADPNGDRDIEPFQVRLLTSHQRTRSPELIFMLRITLGDRERGAHTVAAYV